VKKGGGPTSKAMVVEKGGGEERASPSPNLKTNFAHVDEQWFGNLELAAGRCCFGCSFVVVH